MKFQQLPQSYMDDQLAHALYAREVEWFHYDFDRRNFEAILKRLSLDAPQRADLEKRLAETRANMAYVDAMHAALLDQITDPAAHAAAVARTTAQREAAK